MIPVEIDCPDLIVNSVGGDAQFINNLSVGP
jgi:hypothetical protein